MNCSGCCGPRRSRSWLTFRQTSPLHLLWPSAKPDVALGTRYYAADNQEQGWSEETLWTTNLPIRERQDLRVEVYVPGAAQPAARTAQAVYEITHADGTAVTRISQQRA